jgi:hypothetical protein
MKLKRKNSTPMKRALFVLHFLNIEVSSWLEIQTIDQPSHTRQSLANLLDVSRPTATDVLLLLKKWGFLESSHQGWGERFFLTPKGKTYYETHKEYVMQHARMYQEVMVHNANLK